jgi:hypothetical protein
VVPGKAPVFAKGSISHRDAVTPSLPIQLLSFWALVIMPDAVTLGKKFSASLAGETKKSLLKVEGKNPQCVANENCSSLWWQ